MKALRLIIIVLITILIIPNLMFSQQGGRMGRIDSKAREFFKSRYGNPVIEILEGTHNRVFPSLTFYTVYEEENLVEDPLIPELWVRTSADTFYSVHDMSEALKEEAIVPRNSKEALSLARELLLLQYDGCCVVDGAQSFPGEIPFMYNEKTFYPAVYKTPHGYNVSIHLYYPNHRYAEFYSPYMDNLVEYTVTITGSDYSIQEEQVYSHGENPDEKTLTEAIIEHIDRKGLVKDLTLFLQKRSLYGITDPPDRSQVEQRIAELSALWDAGFVKKHGELHSLVQNVLEENPDFRFDNEYLYQKTKDLKSIRGIEYYQRTLEILLQEIVERTRNNN